MAKPPFVVSQRSLEVDEYIDDYDEDLCGDYPANNGDETQKKEVVKMRDKEEKEDVSEADSNRKAPTMVIEAMQRGRPFKVLSLLLNILATIFYFLSVAGSNWVITSILRAGLWEECTYNPETKENECDRKPCFRVYVNIFVSCCMIGLILSFVSIILFNAGMKQTNIRRKFTIYNVVIAFNLLALFLFAVSLIGYPIRFLQDQSLTNKTIPKFGVAPHDHRKNWSIGWSYVMGWLGVVCSLATAGVLNWDKSSEEVIFYEKISRQDENCNFC